MIYLTLTLFFTKLSLLAIGGLNSTIPAMAQEIVQVRHWATPVQFAQLFAIGQAAPGPNILIVTLIGARVAGIPGGLIATAAFIVPAGLLAGYIYRLWNKFRETKWRRIAQSALLPIGVGLVLSAATVLVRQSDHSILTVAVTCVCAALSWRWRTHPAWLLGGGAAVAGILLA